jgi:glycosyltransferase involved in cell wall biosynthesis
VRILWVTPHFPDPQGSGGTVHQYELLRSIAGRHEVTLITSDWNIEAQTLKTVRDLGVTVRAVAWPWYIRPRTRVSRLIHLLRGAGPTMEVFMNHARLGPLSDAVATEEDARPADLVFLMMGELSPVGAAAKAPTALLLFDVYSRLTDLVRDERSLRAIRHRLERRNASRWEPAWYSRADAVACVSEVDASLVSRMIGRPVEVIPNPIPDDFFDPPAVERSAATVTFVGSFSWEPNRDSVAWLCQDIWPRIRAGRPDAKLCIVGRHGNDELRKQVEGAGGSFLTDVEDIRPFYWEAAVVISPIRMGSGTRNKVLHAMACDAPVVCTTASLEGIPAEHGTHLLVADDPSGLADAVLLTMNDPSAAAARVAAARGIAAKYSSAGTGATFEAWLRAAAASRPAPGAAGSTAARRSLSASVVVVSSGTAEDLRRCLAAVKESVGGTSDVELILVALGGAPADGILREMSLDAKVILAKDGDVLAARNAGWRAAAGDVVLFTDDGCRVPPTWVRAHLESLSDPDVVASFGETTGGPTRRFEPSALPSRHRGATSAPWLVGGASNMAVLGSALEAIGGFDERLASGDEAADADVVARLLRSGSVIASGTGEPVRRDRSSTPAVLSVENRAGVWIGKTLRERPRAALTLMRSRFDEQRHIANGRATEGVRVPRGALALALARGVAEGLRLKPWPRAR